MSSAATMARNGIDNIEPKNHTNTPTTIAVAASDSAETMAFESVNLPQSLCDLPYLVALPSASQLRPIFIIGCGAITEAAHLPAYKKYGFPVLGLFDLRADRVELLAAKYKTRHNFSVLSEVLNFLASPACPSNVVFDVTIPANLIASMLAQLPIGAYVCIQKPLGNNLKEAKEIMRVVEERKQKVNVNFQLRWAPHMMMLRRLLLGKAWMPNMNVNEKAMQAQLTPINTSSDSNTPIPFYSATHFSLQNSVYPQSVIGAIASIDLTTNLDLPWPSFAFMVNQRTELLYHSIHYIDLIRSLLGNPAGVWCKTSRDPRFNKIHSTRSTAIFDYRNLIRQRLTTSSAAIQSVSTSSSSCGGGVSSVPEDADDSLHVVLHANGSHNGGSSSPHSSCRLKLEGSHGCIVVGFSDPCASSPDFFHVYLANDAKWYSLKIEGGRTPEAFIGPMSELMRYAAGELHEMSTSVEDAWKTMVLLETAYESSMHGSTPIVDTSKYV